METNMLKFIPIFSSVGAFKRDCQRRGVEVSKITSQQGKGQDGLKINESILSKFNRDEYIKFAKDVNLDADSLNNIKECGVFLASKGYLIIDTDTKKTFSIVRDIIMKHTQQMPIYRETRQGAHFFLKINSDEFDYNLPTRLDLKQEADLSIEFKRYKESNKSSILYHLADFTYCDGIRQYGAFEGSLTNTIDNETLMLIISEILSHFDSRYNISKQNNLLKLRQPHPSEPYKIGRDVYQTYFKLKEIVIDSKVRPDDILLLADYARVYTNISANVDSDNDSLADSLQTLDNEVTQEGVDFEASHKQNDRFYNLITSEQSIAMFDVLSTFLDMLLNFYLNRYKNSHPIIYSDYYNNLLSCINYYKSLSNPNTKHRADLIPDKIPVNSGIHNTFLFNCLTLLSSQRFTDDADILQEFIKIIDCAFFEKPYFLYNKTKWDRFNTTRIQHQIDIDFVKFGNGLITIDKQTTQDDLDDAIGINQNLFTETTIGKLLFLCPDGIYRAIFSEFRTSRAKSKVFYYVEYCPKRDKYYIAIAQSLDEAFVLLDTADNSKEMNQYFDKILNRKQPSKDGRAKPNKYNDSELMSLTFIGNHPSERTIAPKSKFSIIYDGGRSCSADVSLLGYSDLLIDLLFDNTEQFTKDEFENTIFYQNLKRNLMPNLNVRALHLSSFKNAILNDEATRYCFALDGDGLIGKSSYFDLLMQFIIGEFKFESLTNYRRKPIFMAGDFDNFDTLRVYNSNADIEFGKGVRGSSVFNEDRFLNVVGYKVEEAGDISQKDRIAYVKEIVRVSPSTTIKRKFKNSVQLGKDLKAVCFMLGNKKLIDTSSEDNTRLVQSICKSDFDTLNEFKKLESNPAEYERQRRVFFGYILQTAEFDEIAESLKYKSLAEIDDTSLAVEAQASTQSVKEVADAELILDGLAHKNFEPLVNYINANSENITNKTGPAHALDVALSVIMSSFFTTQYGKNEFKNLDLVNVNWRRLYDSDDARLKNRADVSRLLRDFFIAYNQDRKEVINKIAIYMRKILRVSDDNSTRLLIRFRPEYSLIEKFHKHYYLNEFGKIVNRDSQ